MGFKIERSCRGEGSIYFLLRSTDRRRHPWTAVDVRTEEGVPLPFRLSCHGNDPRVAPDAAIIAVPLLDPKTIEISVAGPDDDGNEGRSSHRVDVSKLKWVSRLNYKTHKGLMEHVKQVSESELFQVRIEPRFFSPVPGVDEYVFKGCVRVPGCGSAVELMVIDGSGRVVDGIGMESGKPSVSYPFGGVATVQDVSVRIPADGKTYCIVAHDMASSKEGFFCFDAASIERCLCRHGSPFYKVIEPQNYSRWLQEQRRRLDFHSFLIDENARRGSTGEKPLFSIVSPLYETPGTFLKQMIGSVLAQSFSDWELVLVNASPGNVEMRSVLAAFDDPRIKVIELEGNEGISGNTNAGIEQASGRYIGLLDHDDVLDVNALSECCLAIEREGADAVYTDEDFLNEHGEREAPQFKSGPNIDLLRCHNCIGHFLVVKAALMKELMLDPEFDGAQDYDLVLRLSEATDRLVHVPSTLYSWRRHEASTAADAGSKDYSDAAGRRALQAHLDRLSLNAEARSTANPNIYDVEYSIEGDPLVSLIIPNKDNAALLTECIESIFSKTGYKDFEVVVVENNSESQETFDAYDDLKRRYGIKVVTWEGPFNYSAINNLGAREAEGDYLVLLNNDTQVINPEWLGSMLSVCQREDVGVVGAKLLYSDDTIQHAGIAFIDAATPGEYGGPVHVFSNLPKENGGYMSRANLRQDVLCVTGACLMTKRSVYEELGGLDETFAVAFNDVDYCLKAREAGYLVVYDPDALLYHFESFSRGSDDQDSKNYPRFIADQGRLRERWPKHFAEPDPYYGQWFIRSV